MDILMMTGLILGEVGVHPAEMGWEDTAAEIERLIHREYSGGQPLHRGAVLALEGGAQQEDSEEENGGRDFKEAAESAAEVSNELDTRNRKGVEESGTSMDSEVEAAEATKSMRSARRRQEEDVQPPQGPQERHMSHTSATGTSRPARSSSNGGGKVRRIGAMTEGRNEAIATTTGYEDNTGER